MRSCGEANAASVPDRRSSRCHCDSGGGGEGRGERWRNERPRSAGRRRDRWCSWLISRTMQAIDTRGGAFWDNQGDVSNRKIRQNSEYLPASTASCRSAHHRPDSPLWPLRILSSIPSATSSSNTMSPPSKLNCTPRLTPKTLSWEGEKAISAAMVIADNAWLHREVRAT